MRNISWLCSKNLLLHHTDTFTVRADPGRPVADPPLVFLKTFLADLKAAGTAPTEFLLFSATMALVLPYFPSPVIFGLFLLFHPSISPVAQW